MMQAEGWRAEDSTLSDKQGVNGLDREMQSTLSVAACNTRPKQGGAAGLASGWHSLVTVMGVKG